MESHRGSSLIFLGFSVILFVISYGIMFLLVPIILGSFFSIDVPISNPAWAQTNIETQEVIRWLVPLVPTVGIFIFIIKVFMVASIRGRD